MQGTLHVIPPDPYTPHRIVKLDRPITAGELQDAVGGPIEAIPNFDSIFRDGRVQLCIAFCNENSKLEHLPLNQWANTLWVQARFRRYGHNDYAELLDGVLVGSVAILTGDTEFLEAL